jgi:hypothetical protein
MKPEEFVSEIRHHAYESAVNGALSLIQKPPGRSPRKSLIELSEWFNSLPESDKRFVKKAVALSAHQATFGILAILDGVRQIEDNTPLKGRLELRYINEGENILLNDPKCEFLHDMFNTE